MPTRLQVLQVCWRLLFVCLVLALALTACNKQEVNVATGPSPVPPFSGEVVVTDVLVSAPRLTFPLPECRPATVDFTATVKGTNVTQTVTWNATGGGNFNSSGTTATLTVDTVGTYQVTATSTQNTNVSGTITVTATGNCGAGSNGPGAFSLLLDGCTTVSSSENRTRFNWTPSSGATGYRVERRVWSVGNWVSQGTTNELTFEQVVANNADFYYRVIAIGSGGETLSTPEELFVCGEAPKPQPPTPSPPPPPPPPPPVPPPPSAPTVTLSASPTSVGQGGQADLTWGSSFASSCQWTQGKSGSATTSGVTTVVLTQTTTFTIVCTGPGGSTQASALVTVTAPACSTSIDYSPKGGTIAANQNRALKVDNWPSSQCMPFWYLDRKSNAQITGADTVIIIDGTPYYAGVNAVLRGVYPGGPVSVCVQTSIVTPEVKRCYDWTVTSASAFGLQADDPLPSGLMMNVPGVSQTYTPKK